MNNRFMHVILALSLAALMIFSCACSSPAAAPAAEAQPATEPAQQPAAEEPAVQSSTELSPNAGALIGVSLYSRRSQNQLDLEAGLRASAAQFGFSLLMEDADTDPARQNEQLKSFIDKKVDAILVNPTDTAAIKDTLLAASAAGIPVVTMELAAEDSGASAHLGFNYEEEGKDMAAWLSDYINNSMGGSANIGVIDFASCKSICQVKLSALTEALTESCPGAVWLAKYDGEGKRSASMDACEQLLKKNPDTNIVIVFNADAAGAAKEIIDDMKKEGVVIFGSAYGDDMFQALESSDPAFLAIAADQYYQIGFDSAATVDKLLSGESVEASTIYPSLILTAENIAEYDWHGIASQREA